jgi:hypothetical protein
MTELDPGERAELERLRARVAALERPPGGGRRAARWAASALLTVLAVLVAVGGVLSVYAKTQLLDTERYVATVAPLARDADVREAVADRLTDELMTRLDLEGVSKQLVEALQNQGAPAVLGGLTGPITDGIRSFIHDRIAQVVSGERFAAIWDNANRTAHSELAAVLTGSAGDLLSVDDNTVYLDLGAIFTEVKQRLVDHGFALVERVPDIAVTVPLFASDEIGRVQRLTALLETAAWLLPVLVVLLLAAAVATAPNRRRALLLGVAGFAFGMLLLLGAVKIGRALYAENLPDSVRSPDAALAIYDAAARLLIGGLQTLLVVSLIVVLAAWLLGPGRAATALRGTAARGLGRIADAMSRNGFGLGAFAAAVARYRIAIEVGLVVIAAGTLVLWRHPGVTGALWTAAVLAVLVIAIELVARLDTEQAGQPQG